MKIAIYQLDIIWESAKENRDKISNTMPKLFGKCDLLILPEMFTTGFNTNPQSISETMDGESVAFLKEMSKQYNIAIIGSIIIDDNGKIFNRMMFVTPDGDLPHYDKRHLFRMSGEDKTFSAGQDKRIFRYKGFNILPQVCYDLRFPVWSRNKNLEYDIAIYVASWPRPRIKVWDILLKARSLENLCYTIGVNRVGTDPAIDYNGHSCIIDYLGNIVAETQENKEEYIIYEIDKESLDKFRSKFPAQLDADDFTID